MHTHQDGREIKAGVKMKRGVQDVRSMQERVQKCILDQCRNVIKNVFFCTSPEYDANWCATGEQRELLVKAQTCDSATVSVSV